MTQNNCKKILFVDDDPDDLFLIREILQNLNVPFEIHEAYNGKQALSFLENAKASDQLPCLIVMDINMPVMNGKETLAAIKNEDEYKHIPVVIFSTSKSELDRMFFEKYNVEMMTKPPGYQKLEGAVKRLLNYSNG
jgi:CheY-like chemotaxis protein